LLKSQLQELQEAAYTHPWKLGHKPQGLSSSRVSPKAKQKVAETTKASAQQNPYMIRIILDRHTSYNVNDLKALSSVISM
jgi:hypothetical protein